MTNMENQLNGARQYLLASDFDQTLSFNDSGVVLSELLGRPGFEEKVAGMARTRLVQQGGELAYATDPSTVRVARHFLAGMGQSPHGPTDNSPGTYTTGAPRGDDGPLKIVSSQ